MIRFLTLHFEVTDPEVDDEELFDLAERMVAEQGAEQGPLVYQYADVETYD